MCFFSDGAEIVCSNKTAGPLLEFDLAFIPCLAQSRSFKLFLAYIDLSVCVDQVAQSRSGAGR